MLDLGWTELLVIGAIALLVVGPRDLPRVLRYVGYWTGKARSMAREFQKAIDQYAKEADLEDVKKAVQTPARARNAIKNAIDPRGELSKEMSETERSLKQGLKDATSGGKDSSEDKPATATPAAAGSAGAATPAQSIPDDNGDTPKAQAG
jgi:sec-independent protein translocase protein TatB